ncbi:hypothetical protein JW887_00275 [Candidatus Dojkabacteria bacterium]|nr:hypothetical protein [Candidatus Dojkabacteria bacterium]
MPGKKKISKSAKQKVRVLHIKCTNCGEEDVKAIYCDHCESPYLDIEIVEKNLDDVENDDSIVKTSCSHDIKATEKAATEPDAEADTESDIVGSPDENDVWESGLGEIFPGSEYGDDEDGTHGDDHSEGADDLDLNDMVDILDNE